MSKVRIVEPEGFADFWAAWMPYRRKNDGRGDARDCYRKHILMGAEPQDIIDGAKAYLRKLSPEERKFIPLAATWLNRESYADYVEEQREYERKVAERAAQAQQAPAPASNVHIIHKQDNRPTEEERARHAQSVLARAGLAAQG